MLAALSLSFHLLCDHVYAQVKGDGVKAAAVHELDPLLLRLGVVSLDVAAHPRNLTCPGERRCHVVPASHTPSSAVTRESGQMRYL